MIRITTKATIEKVVFLYAQHNYHNVFNEISIKIIKNNHIDNNDNIYNDNTTNKNTTTNDNEHNDDEKNNNDNVSNAWPYKYINYVLGHYHSSAHYI